MQFIIEKDKLPSSVIAEKQRFGNIVKRLITNSITRIKSKTKVIMPVDIRLKFYCLKDLSTWEMINNEDE